MNFLLVLHASSLLICTHDDGEVMRAIWYTFAQLRLYSFRLMLFHKKNHPREPNDGDVSVRIWKYIMVCVVVVVTVCVRYAAEDHINALLWLKKKKYFTKKNILIKKLLFMLGTYIEILRNVCICFFMHAGKAMYVYWFYVIFHDFFMLAILRSHFILCDI